MPVSELNIDGLVGPTHNYAGLSLGNLASISHKGFYANPREAALQGLKKMRFLHQMGIKQAILPPQQRPNLRLLYQLGFKGTSKQQIERAFYEAPQLLRAAFSASSMWAANASTVSPSSDCSDHKVHFTPANLLSNLHRYQETPFTGLLLKKIFGPEQYFEHHPPLPNCSITSDEGAANHGRLCQAHSLPGIHLFVYGSSTITENALLPTTQYPARQSHEASLAVARSHGLDSSRVIFARQNPEAIDQGVFHNDVIALTNESLFLVHEKAYFQQKKVYEALNAKADFPINLIEIADKRLSIREAVNSYLFNSQIITMPDQSMLLLAPLECQQQAKTRQIIDDMLADPSNPLSVAHYFDLKQSMQNGGGPACLRLRVLLKEEELKAMHQGVLIDDALLEQLETWVKHHYREQLSLEDLTDPALIEESFTALDNLTKILKLGPIYPFQQEN